MNSRKSVVPRYPPVVPRIVKPSRRATPGSAFPFPGEGVAAGADDAGGAPPRPNAIPLNTSGCATAMDVFAGTTRSVHSAVAVVGAKHVVSLQAWYRNRTGILSS